MAVEVKHNVQVRLPCEDGFIVRAVQCKPLSVEVCLYCGEDLFVVDGDTEIVVKTFRVEDKVFTTNPFTLEYSAEETTLPCAPHALIVCCRDGDKETVLHGGLLAVLQ